MAEHQQLLEESYGRLDTIATELEDRPIVRDALFAVSAKLEGAAVDLARESGQGEPSTGQDPVAVTGEELKKYEADLRNECAGFMERRAELLAGSESKWTGLFAQISKAIREGNPWRIVAEEASEGEKLDAAEFALGRSQIDRVYEQADELPEDAKEERDRLTDQGSTLTIELQHQALLAISEGHSAPRPVALAVLGFKRRTVE
jgi:hypothetical protein